jgi:hypothetical protein
MHMRDMIKLNSDDVRKMGPARKDRVGIEREREGERLEHNILQNTRKPRRQQVEQKVGCKEEANIADNDYKREATRGWMQSVFSIVSRVISRRLEREREREKGGGGG